MIGHHLSMSGVEYANLVPASSSVPRSPNLMDWLSISTDSDSNDYVIDQMFDEKEFVSYADENISAISMHNVVSSAFHNAISQSYVFKINFNSIRLSELRPIEGISLLDAVEAADKIAVWEKSGQERLASFFAVYFVERSHKHLAFEVINKLLLRSDVDKLSAWSLVALLRSSFPARKFLPAWEPLLDAVRRKLDDSGENAAKILRGLRP